MSKSAKGSGWLEQIIVGALSRGINRPTFVLLNIVLLLCCGVLVTLLVRVRSAELAAHLGVLLFFAIGLTVSVNWVVSQVGFTSADVQRRELLGKRPLLVERTESSASSSDYKQQ